METPDDTTREMTFLEHLEELRHRLMVVLAVVMLGAVAGYELAPALFDITMRGMPADVVVDEEAAVTRREKLVDALSQVLERDATLVSPVADALEEWIEAAGISDGMGTEIIVTRPAGSILTRMKIAIFIGVVLGFPVILFQGWSFVSPGLVDRERRLVVPFVMSGILCFGIGTGFAYTILPFLTAFFTNISVEMGMQQRWVADDYLGFVLRLVLAGGVLFQFPVVSYFLSRLGIITAATLRTHRRVAFVLILMIAAAVTPPDPVSMLVMGIPLLGLYEISIGLAVWGQRAGKR